MRLLYHYNNVLSHSLLTGVCGLIYVCLYVLKRKRPRHVKPFGYKYLVRNDFVMKIFPFIHFSNFHLEMTYYSHELHLWCRGNERQLRKPILYYLVCKEKLPCCENIFMVCLLIQRWMTTPHSSFNTLFSLLLSLSSVL